MGRKGPDFGRISGGYGQWSLKVVLDGSDETNRDWDSAQVAVRWSGGASDGTRWDNITPEVTGTIPNKYGGGIVRTAGGAHWDEEEGNANEAYYEVPLPVPSDATDVDIVVVFTDIIFGQDHAVSAIEDLTDIRAGDMAAVIASFTGHKHADKNDIWTFKNNDGINGAPDDTAQLQKYPPNYRLPTQTERSAQKDDTTNNVLKPRVGYQLVPRTALANHADTGFDLKKAP